MGGGLKRRLVFTWVSIPLWFSLNLTQGGDENADAESFPSHYGSRSTCEDITRKTHEIAVSIPLWFSLNQDLSQILCEQIRFHPTMVLAQLFDRVGIDNPLLLFPSHYGSRSTWPFLAFVIIPLMFPSHYGSRST